MRFKIYSKTSDGNAVVHYYDNQTLDITTEDGIPVVLSEDPRCANLVNTCHYAPLDQLKSKNPSLIEKLRITLGFNCNFHCKYCYESKTPQIKIHEDLDVKAQHLVDSIKSKLPNLKHVTYWGGEPLVYLKLIKRLHPLLLEAYPDLKFSAITNGALLTLENAKWLVENQIRMVISHDGPAFKAYRDDEDPLDNPKSLEGIKYILEHDDIAAFNVVITPENADLQKIVPFFVSKLGFIPKIHFESIVKLLVSTRDIITPFDDATIKTLLNNVVAYGSTPDNEHAYGMLRDNVTTVLRRLINKKFPESPCMIVDKDYLAINAEGDLLECHGNLYKYGTLSNIENAGELQHVHSWRDRPTCANCPFVLSCCGGCTVLDDNDFFEQCKTVKIWHAGFFIAAWKILFNSTITRIEAIGEL